MRNYGLIQYYRTKQKDLSIRELERTGFENDEEIHFR